MVLAALAPIKFLRECTTLVPGTVILTGIPQGVGVADKPAQRGLSPGDTVTLEIEKIGRFTNPVALETS